MKNQKNNDSGAVVEEYTFMNFMDTEIPDGSVEEFNFSNIEEKQNITEETKSKTIRIERKFAKDKSFTISPITREYRGIDEQVEEDRNLRISSEVDRKLIKLHSDATYKGYNEGVEKGKLEIYEQTRQASEEKVALLTNMISEVLKTREVMMEKQRLDIYETIRNLTKWIILRELKDDGEYIKRLLEKLILEIHTKSDLVVHIDQKNFETMPEVLGVLTSKLGELSNIRVEIDYGIEGAGIVLDSRNGIINGTLKEQFSSLDDLFSNIGLPFSHEFSLTKDMESKNEATAFQKDDDHGEE